MNNYVNLTNVEGFQELQIPKEKAIALEVKLNLFEQDLKQRKELAAHPCLRIIGQVLYDLACDRCQGVITLPVKRSTYDVVEALFQQLP